MTLKEAERALMVNALEKTNWVQKDAAKLLGISKRVMNYKIKMHGIQNQRWRRGK
jgi:transcriptional regulator with GAF, ATPase, and Fis domain